MNFANFIWKHRGFVFLLIFVLFWISSLVVYSPEEIISFVGVENAYLILFFSALIGVSGLASLPFYTIFITMASSGEFNFFLLIAVAVPGMAFGDALFFLFGHKGHFALSEFAENKTKKISAWIKKQPSWVIPFIAYIYTSFSPLPQDILMFILGFGRAKFRYVIVAVLLGNTTFISLIYLFSVSVFSEIGIFN